MLTQNPPCPWERTRCLRLARENSNAAIVAWIEQRPAEGEGSRRKSLW